MSTCGASLRAHRWPRCDFRLSWNPNWRCHNRAILGRCVEHHLDRLRLHWGTPWSSFTVELSNVNRLLWQLDEERPRQWLAVSWGTTGCDPVWSLQLNRKGHG